MRHARNRTGGGATSYAAGDSGPDGLIYIAITGGEVTKTPILRLEPVP